MIRIGELLEALDVVENKKEIKRRDDASSSPHRYDCTSLFKRNLSFSVITAVINKLLSLQIYRWPHQGGIFL